jgi:endonuclease V-like protein UPF0215 family
VIILIFLISVEVSRIISKVILVEMITNIKKGIQVVAIDDSIHERGDEKTEIVFLFCTGTLLEKIFIAKIDVDGFNSTRVIIDTLKPVLNHFRLLVTHGITVGGFNLFDIQKIHNELKKPIIAVTENEPSGNSIRDAIKNLPDYEKRKEIIDNAGELYSVKTSAGDNELYFHVKGISEKMAKQYLKKFAVRSRLPECLLLAHKIGSGLKEKK